MKRIERIAKGETVMVQMIAEDLQDFYDRLDIARDDALRAAQEARENPGEEGAKKFQLLHSKADILRISFWNKIHMRYGNWDKNIGLRDGYALVLMPGSKKDAGFGEFLKGIAGAGWSGPGGIGGKLSPETMMKIIKLLKEEADGSSFGSGFDIED